MSKNNFNQNNSKLNFDVQSNMINDSCYVDSYLKQTQGPGNYFRNNLRSQVCEAPAARKMALTQPNVNFTDGYGYSAMNGCNIDVDSGLRNNPEALTNKKCIQTLNERPYLTVPFMGRGTGDINNELDVLKGESTFVRKGCNTLAGYDYSDRHFVPMIEKLDLLFTHHCFAITKRLKYLEHTQTNCNVKVKMIIQMDFACCGIGL